MEAILKMENNQQQKNRLELLKKLIMFPLRLWWRLRNKLSDIYRYFFPPRKDWRTATPVDAVNFDLKIAQTIFKIHMKEPMLAKQIASNAKAISNGIWRNLIYDIEATESTIYLSEGGNIIPHELFGQALPPQPPLEQEEVKKEERKPIDVNSIEEFITQLNIPQEKLAEVLKKLTIPQEKLEEYDVKSAIVEIR